MAPKRSSLLEDPPVVSSSEEEVETEEEEEPTAEGGAGTDDSDSDDSDKSPERPTVIAAPKIKKPQADSESDSDSENDDDEDRKLESESDTEGSPMKPSDLYRVSVPIVRSANVKSVDATTKPKKTVAKPTASTGTSSPSKPSAAGKRPLESEKAEKEDSKRKKKKVSVGSGSGPGAGVADDDDSSHPEDDGKKSIDDHKSPFQRLWSEDDEIVILKGIRDGIKKGIDPTSHLDQFLDTIKKSIHVSFNKEQLNNKIRRMKNKYLNMVKKGKAVEDPVFKKPHGLQSYELMKEIWGGQKGHNKKGGEGDSSLANGKKNRTPKPKSGAVPASPKTVTPTDISDEESPRVEKSNSSLFSRLTESVQVNNNLAVMGASLLKEGLGLIGESKAKELEQKWRKLHSAELEVYLKRLELLREQAIAVLKAINSLDA